MLGLPSSDSLRPSPKSVSYSGALASTNAIKTSIATSTSTQNYTGVALNGTIGASSMFPMRTITVTTTASAATYNTSSPIVVSGTDANGVAITANLQLTLTGGGETIVSTIGFAAVTGIAIPAQTTATGTFVFGVQDCMCSDPPRQVRVGASGNLKVGYADGSTDIIPSLLSGDKMDINPTKIFGDANTTVQSITLLF